MKKKIFVRNAIILTSITLITRSIGVWFRVYMSNKVGSQGIGLLSLITTVYIFSATFATSGITLAVTRLVTDSIASSNYGGAKYIVKKCLMFSIILATIVGGAMFIYAPSIGVIWLSDVRTVLSLKILSVSLPFMAVSACLRGYFFARRTAINTASEQLIEQIIEIVVFLLLINAMLPYGVEYGCCAIVIGTTAAEILSCAYSGLLYYIDIRKIKEKEKKFDGFLKKVLAIGIPVTLSSCLRAGLNMIENVLIPFGLKKNGASSETALSEYGEIVGMVMPVMTFPNVFLFCFSQLMIPEMSEAKIKNHTNSIEYMASRIFRFSLLFALPVSGAFLFFGSNLGIVIYNSAEIGLFIQLLAPIIPLVYLDQVVDGMLKGLNEQLHYLMYNIIDSITRVSLTFILLPIMGIKGVIIVIYVSAILNSGLSIARLLKVSQVKTDWLNWLLKPILCILISGLITMHITMDNILTQTIVQITAFALLYLLILTLLKGIKKEERQWVKNLVSKKKL